MLIYASLPLKYDLRPFVVNFKGIKRKILRFKSIFEAHWSAFVCRNPRYDTDYYHAEINKMLTCGSEAGGFAVYQCLSCGKGEHKVNFSCALSVGNAMPEKVWSRSRQGFFLGLATVKPC